MSKQHMNPEEAARAFTDLGARHFVAMHFGTFKLTDEPLDERPRASPANGGGADSIQRLVTCCRSAAA